jgi:hypothetical protein
MPPPEAMSSAVPIAIPDRFLSQADDTFLAAMVSILHHTGSIGRSRWEEVFVGLAHCAERYLHADEEQAERHGDIAARQRKWSGRWRRSRCRTK